MLGLRFIGRFHSVVALSRRLVAFILGLLDDSLPEKIYMYLFFPSSAFLEPQTLTSKASKGAFYKTCHRKPKGCECVCIVEED